jgi:hypothetical protein
MLYQLSYEIDFVSYAVAKASAYNQTVSSPSKTFGEAFEAYGLAVLAAFP